MKHKDFFWKIIFIMCLSLAVTIWIVTFVIPQANYSFSDERTDVSEFNDGWTVYAGSNSYENVNTFVDITSNEQIVLVRTLPTSYHFSIPTVFFRTNEQSVEVYIDDEKIYGFGDSSPHLFISTTPSRWNIVGLPQDSVGKELKIMLRSECDASAGYVPGFMFGPRSQCYSYILEKGMPGLILSVALIVIVIMLLILLMLTNRKTSGFRMVMWWGLTVLLAGMWSLGTLGILQLVFSSPYVEWLLSNTAAFFIVPSLLMVIHEYYDDEKTRRFAEIVAHLNLILILICLFVQLLGIIDLTMLGTVPLVFAILSVVVFSYGAVRTRRKDTLIIRITNAFASVTLTAIVVSLSYIYNNHFRTKIDIYVRYLFVIIALVWTFMIVKSLIDRTKKYEQMKKSVEEKQMTMMVHQIKPHFIYNALGAIRAEISEDPQKASAMLYDFSKYLRAHVDTLSVDKPIAFEEELANVKNYVRLEQARFGDKINVVYETEHTSFLIPPLTVQPLVENAIVHGLRKKKHGGTVTIRSYETKKENIVEVIDNGVGFDSSRFDVKEKEKIRFIDLFKRNKNEEEKENEQDDFSSGVRNIKFRVSAMVGGTVEIKSREGEGTISRVVLPK